MYKVFLNDRIIVIASGDEIISKFVDFEVVEVSNLKVFLKSVNHFLKSDGNICLLVDDCKKVFQDVFSRQFLNIKAAGGVVIKNDMILFIFRRGYWDLPKGKIDEGETSEEAAAREVAEETGIGNLQILKQLPSTWHLYQSPYKKTKGKWILKETLWFEMETTGKQKPVPQTEEDIIKAEWISKQDLNQILNHTYSNLKQIINPYL